MSIYPEYVVSLPRAAALLRLPLDYLLLALTNDLSFPLPIPGPVGLLVSWAGVVEWSEEGIPGHLSDICDTVGGEFSTPVDIPWGRAPMRATG